MTSNCATTCSLYLIPSSHLQNISHDILTFLTTLINSSLTSGCIPAPFKTATTKPLLKNPPLTKVTSTTTDIFLFFHSSIKPWNTTSATNCPIFHKTTSLTLISQASGLLTPLTRQSSQWLSHSTLQTKPRPTHQSSFSSTYSLRLTVTHQFLLTTLTELGIADSALNWFRSYLTNCTFHVTWNGSLSKPGFLETGVLQGLILWPLLFLLYSRSLDSAITLHGFFYYCYALFLSFPAILQYPHYHVHHGMSGRHLLLVNCAS